MARSRPRFIKENRSSGLVVQRSANEKQVSHTYHNQQYPTHRRVVTLCMHPRLRDKLCPLEMNTTLALGRPGGMSQTHRLTMGICRIHLPPIAAPSPYAKALVLLSPTCITRVMKLINPCHLYARVRRVGLRNGGTAPIASLRRAPAEYTTRSSRFSEMSSCGTIQAGTSSRKTARK